jgi:MFS family permease
MMALCGAILYGILYILNTTIPFTYSVRYGFSPHQTGLVYLAPGLGMIVGLLTYSRINSAIMRRFQAQNAGWTPEDRIPLWVTGPAIAMVSSGLAIYGWTTEQQAHWAVPLIGLALFGWGIMPLTMSVGSYMVESFPNFSANALAANGLLRALTMGLFPLIGVVMYDGLGFGAGNTLLAGISAGSAIMPVVCRVWGGKLRERWQVNL